MLPTHRELEREASSCTRCALAEVRTNVPFSSGDPEADLMVVGESPGKREDLLGAPFEGALGNLLNKALGDAGLTRDEVYVTNVVKCVTPDLRRPEIEEIKACSGYLMQQIAIVRPRVIVTLGDYATRLLLQRDLPMNKIAGYRFDIFDGITLVPTYPPVLALRGNGRAAAAIRRDIKMASMVLDGRLSSAAAAEANLKERARANV